MGLIENGQVLKPDMFHRHWWLDRGITEEVGQRARILEPNPIRQRRKDTRKNPKNGKSTRRVPSHFERVDLNHPASSNPSDNLPLTQPACQVRDLPTNEPIQVPVTQPLMQLLPQPQNPFPLVSKPPTQTQQGMLQPVQGQATQYQISTQHLPSVQTNQQYHTYQPPAPMMCNYPPAYQQPIPQVGQPHPSVSLYRHITIWFPTKCHSSELGSRAGHSIM